MSYRELRNFTEMLRALGYPRLVSVENFRTPNFNLVADILHWLIKRYEPTSDLSLAIDTEQDRVIFVKACTHIMASKGRIRINSKRIYQGDGYAVKELLKIASVLYSAMHRAADDDEDNPPPPQDASVRLMELRGVREIASDITSRGATLFDLLGKEEELRDVRQRAISRNLVLKDVEAAIRSHIQHVVSDSKEMTQAIQSLDADIRNLDGKIEKKRSELDRSDKRLKSLQTTRPPFMDEIDKHEGELNELFRVYLEKFRNVDYLEAQLEEFNLKEQRRIDASQAQMTRMQRKLRDEELKIMRGEMEIDEAAIDNDLLNRDSDDELDDMDLGGKAAGGGGGGAGGRDGGRRGGGGGGGNSRRREDGRRGVEGRMQDDDSDDDSGSAISEDDVTSDEDDDASDGDNSFGSEGGGIVDANDSSSIASDDDSNGDGSSGTGF